MPVRIYEIAKDLNLESKAVIAKAIQTSRQAAPIASIAALASVASVASVTSDASDDWESF